jgi:pimeloyl-ACP methyl ester carboxylesterase
MVLWGVHDPWQRIEDGERLAEEIPGAMLERVVASHWVPCDAPDEFSSAIVSFLRASARSKAALT